MLTGGVTPRTRKGNPKRRKGRSRESGSHLGKMVDLRMLSVLDGMSAPAPVRDVPSSAEAKSIAAAEKFKMYYTMLLATPKDRVEEAKELKKKMNNMFGMQFDVSN